MASSKHSQYTIARSLHWFAAFIIAFNLLSGWKLADLPMETKTWIIMIHSGIGVTIFLLMLLRWWWRKKNNLYAPPGFWKKPTVVLMWIFYPLVLLQTILGMSQALFTDYDVRAYGFINFSALADANEGMRNLFLDLHGTTAILLIVLVLVHGAERSRKAFADDGQQMKGQSAAPADSDIGS
jgi:cytochrome b561